MYPAGMLRTKPVRPYRNFAHFVDKQTWFGSVTGQYPCLTCHGLGWHYDPNDPPCSVEGNRNRATVICPVCKGTKQGSQKACRQGYRAAIARYQAQASEYKRLVQARKEALSLLTEKQIQALKELGL